MFPMINPEKSVILLKVTVRFIYSPFAKTSLRIEVGERDQT